MCTAFYRSVECTFRQAAKAKINTLPPNHPATPGLANSQRIGTRCSQLTRKDVRSATVAVDQCGTHGDNASRCSGEYALFTLSQVADQLKCTGIGILVHARQSAYIEVTPSAGQPFPVPSACHSRSRRIAQVATRNAKTRPRFNS